MLESDSLRSPIRRGVALAGRGGGGHLARAPAADRERHLHHPARRVADGAVLPPHAVLRHSRLLSRRIRARWGIAAVARVRARHGQQGGDGLGPDPDVALRLVVRLADPSARCSAGAGGSTPAWPPPGSSWRSSLATSRAEEQRVHGGWPQPVELRADPVRGHRPLPAAGGVAPSPGIRLRVADRRPACLGGAVGGRRAGLAGGHRARAAQTAVGGVLGRLVLPHPRPDLQHPADRRRGLRAPHVPAAGGAVVVLVVVGVHDLLGLSRSAGCGAPADSGAGWRLAWWSRSVGSARTTRPSAGTRTIAASSRCGATLSSSAPTIPARTCNLGDRLDREGRTQEAFAHYPRGAAPQAGL